MTVAPRLSPVWLRALVLALVALLGAAMVLGGPAHAEPETATGRIVEVLHVEGSHGLTEGETDPHELPIPQGIALISDCRPGENPPNCGNPPARWSAANRPVQLCTVTSGLPLWLTGEQFRQTVADAAAAWNRAEVPLGIRYTGECAIGTIAISGDNRNEIGFQAGQVVPGGEAAVTDLLTTWTPPSNPQTRTIAESDILFPSGFPSSQQCFLHAVLHEFGHVLGLGHSTDTNDVMYSTINFANTTRCRSTPSDAELTRLQDVYGINRAPTADAGGTLGAAADRPVQLSGKATDPENDALTYGWAQLSGPPVSLTGATTLTPSFTPAGSGEYAFLFTVTDRYMHQASSRVTVTVAPPDGSGSVTPNITGAVPPSGFGLFVFGGGSTARLLEASGCPAGTAAFWVSDGRGDFVIWVPGSTVAAVNQRWVSLFPQGLPPNTPVLGRCR